jgi:hypothetical protein
MAGRGERETMSRGLIVRETRKAWRASVRERREQRMIELLQAKVPFAEYARELLEQEKEFLREARSPAERRRIQQITVKDIITEAYSHGAGWEEFGPLLRRCQRLGYADLTHRIHVVCLFVQSLPRFPEKAPQAFALLREVERMALRIRKTHYLRKEGLQAIVHARRVAEAAGIKPVR